MEIKHKQYVTAYNLWLNENTELDSRRHTIRISDIDSVVQNYRSGRFLLLEWKCRNASVRFPQSEIIQTIHQDLKRSGDCRYAGYIIIRLSAETPADSSEIYISGEIFAQGKSFIYDNSTITSEKLTKMLQLNW